MKKTKGKITKEKITSGKILFYVCIIFISYVFIRYFIEVQLLKHYGICKKGIITDVRLTSRYTTSVLPDMLVKKDNSMLVVGDL